MAKRKREVQGYVLVTIGNGQVEDALETFGMRPLVADNTESSLSKLYNICDAVVIPGGVDISPELYGAEAHGKTQAPSDRRDTIEHYIAQRALSDGKPILGICRGNQMLNVAAAGTLVQDIPSQIVTDIKHTYQRHDVFVTDTGGIFRTICNADRYNANSLHHQCVDKLGYRFKVVARAEDGIPEAIMSTEHPFALGVQFHPEMLVSQKHEQSQSIFDALRWFTRSKYTKRSEHSRRRSHQEYRKQLEYSDWVREYYRAKPKAKVSVTTAKMPTVSGVIPLRESDAFNCDRASTMTDTELAQMYGAW